MQARRIALAAVITTIVGTGVAIGVRHCFEPARAHDLHMSHRVEIDVPAVEAALWLAARHPRYFTSGEAELEAWLDTLPAHDRDLVLAISQTLMWAWVEHELQGLQEREPAELAREIGVRIRLETLNQLDLNPTHFEDSRAIDFDASIAEPGFGAGVFARLVRGVSNCEGQNHLVAILLESAFASNPADDDIEVAMIAIDDHDLVRLSGPTLDQPLYVDAWSNVLPFTLADLDDPAIELVPGVAGRSRSTAEAYADASPTQIELVPRRDAPTRPISFRLRAPALDEAALASRDPWQLYLFARILHLYDDPRAASVYRWLLERHCPRGTRLFVCAASTALVGLLDRSTPNSI